MGDKRRETERSSGMLAAHKIPYPVRWLLKMVLTPPTVTPSGLPKYRAFPSRTAEKYESAHNARLVS